eukprot:evm.model.scf_807EXC.3 EVM.evm.TU.scf_807EXC.3   scf_807EXC:18076-22205(+)
MGGEVSKRCSSVEAQATATWEDLDADLLDDVVRILRKSGSRRCVGTLRATCRAWRGRIDFGMLHLTLWRRPGSASPPFSRVFPNLLGLELRCERSAGLQTNALEDVFNLRHLRELDISRCWDCVTSGFSNLGSLARLQKLALNGAEFAALGETMASSPGAAEGVSRVSCLVLRGCESVSDHHLSVVKEFSSLSRLLLIRAKGLTAQGLQCLTMITGLRDLSLTAIENLNSADIGCLQRLSSLTSLRLYRLGVNDNWCARIQCLSSLKRLSLAGCEGVTDAGLRAVASLPELSSLRICWQQNPEISLSGITQLGELPNLKRLELFQCGDMDVDVVKAHFDVDVGVRIMPAPEKLMLDHYNAHDIDAMEQLLESVQEPDAKEVPVPGCFTPHHLMIHAADNCQLGVLKLLARFGADVDYGDSLFPMPRTLVDCSTPLHFAVYHGDTEVVKELVNSGARLDAHCTEDYRTPLHFACVGGDLKLVRCLLDAGAGVDRSDDFGRTPLYAAVQWGRKDVIRELLRRGADPEKRDLNSHTGLHFACKVGNLDLVEFLVSLGLDVDSGARYGLPTPLQTAAENGQLAVAKFLHRRGGSLNETPLFLAAKRGHLETVQYLLHYFRQVRSSEVLRTEDGDGKTLLHYGAEHGWTGVVEELLSKEVNHPVNKGDHDGFAPLYYADRNGHKDIVRLLSKRGGLARWLSRPPLYKCTRWRNGCSR